VVAEVEVMARLRDVRRFNKASGNWVEHRVPMCSSFFRKGLLPSLQGTADHAKTWTCGEQGSLLKHFKKNFLTLA
jgi:hypothetical protein